MNFYVIKSKPLRNFAINHQLLIAGPMIESDAFQFAMNRAKLDNTWSYGIIEMVKE